MTCRELPFRKYWSVIESGDLRHILDCDVLPQYYDLNLLQESWDKIMKEYESLTGILEYTGHLKKINYRFAKQNDLNILTGCYLLMRLGSEQSLDHLKILGIHMTEISKENVQKLQLKIISKRTREEIESIIKKDLNKEKVLFEDIIINLQMAVNMPIDKNISLLEYIRLVKAINKRNEEIKSYGRKD